jgi:hypothetical protein
MKPIRDIERTLDQWFAPGPERVPERVLERALTNIEHIPQRRGIASRRFKMPTNLRLLAVAAVLAAAGGATYLLIGSNREARDQAPTPVLGINGAAATWSAERPGVFGYQAGTYEFDTYSASVARSPDGKTIPLGQITADGATAQLGKTMQCLEEGTYRYRQSADFLTLVVEAVSDSCVDRRTLIEGEWQRVRADLDLEVGRAYTVDMGVLVDFVVPEWPSVPSPGPYVSTEGPPGQAPHEIHIGTDKPNTHLTDYELKLVVDPRLAKDVCHIAKGWLDEGWTLDDVAARKPASKNVTFSPPRRSTVSGFPAVVIDVADSEDCFNDQFTEEQCCPDDVIWWNNEGRFWVVDMGSRKVFIAFVGMGHAVTEAQLAIGTELVASLRLTLPPPD